MIVVVSAAARDINDAATGAMLGTFAGDALGRPYDDMPASRRPGRLELCEGSAYSDHPELMISLAESLVEHNRIEPNQLADAFARTAVPSRGYGSTALECIKLWRQGVPVHLAARRLFDGVGSLGSGAAIRVAPVAIRFCRRPDQLRREAARSAHITHTHPLGIDAAVAQAASVAAALRGERILRAAYAAAETALMRRQLTLVGELLERSVGPDDVADALGNTAAGPEAVPTAIYAALTHEGVEDAVSFAVRCNGDAGGTAAMAGAIAGARAGARALPENWLVKLESGPRGRWHVERLAEALCPPRVSRAA